MTSAIRERVCNVTPTMTSAVRERVCNVTSTTRFPDPTRRWAVTKRAMTLYLLVTEVVSDAAQDEYREWIDALPDVVNDCEYDERLDSIRDYAKEECDATGTGTNCLEGTNEFLSKFSMPELDPRTNKRVTVTVTVAFDVYNDANEYATEHDVRRYLDISADGNVDDMENVAINIDSIDVENE